MREWTENQRQAVERRGSALLVGAGAGSGKTAVLAGRFVSLVSDGEAPLEADRILVLTFSKAAAAELRRRIRQELAERSRNVPSDARLRRQLRKLSRAQISTVHAFCASLLREYETRLDIPAGFSVADELASAELRARAMEHALDRLYSDAESGFEEFSELFGKSRTDASASDVTAALHEFLTMFTDPEAWKEKTLSQQQVPFYSTAAWKTLLGRAQVFADAALVRAKAALYVLTEKDGYSQPDERLTAAYLPAIEDDAAMLQRLCEALKKTDGNTAFAMVRSHSWVGFKGVRGCEDPRKEAVNALRSEYKAIFKKLQESVFALSEEEENASAGQRMRACEALLYAGEVFAQELAKQKKRRKLLEYSDLENEAIKLMEETGDEIPSRFDCVMVDEFQDTNETQSRIFELISAGKGKLFAVGDVKQSIYGFRRADPETFRALKKSIGDGYIPLSDNFRSSSALVGAFNTVFDALFTDSVGGANYETDGRMTPRGSARDEDPPVSVMLVSGADKDKSFDAQAGTIADETEKLIASGAARPQDVAVLLSTWDHAGEIVKALTARGIPASQRAGEDFFESSETEVFIALLTLIEDPSDDLAAAAVMLSPLFSFGAEYLASLRVDSGEGSLTGAAKRRGDEKSAHFCDTLDTLASLKNDLSVPRLLEEASELTDAELLLTMGPDHARRLANIRALLLSGADYEKSVADPSLAGFLRRCERARKSKKRPASRTAASSGSVTVSTIHSAKGLEWDYVFLADADRQFNKKDSSVPPVLFSASLGVGMKLRYEDEQGLSSRRTTLRYRALSAEKTQKDTSEHMRALYVAATRARVKLFVTAKTDDAEAAEKKLIRFARGSQKPDMYDVVSCKSLVEWVLMGLLWHSSPQAVQLSLENHGFVRTDCALIRVLECEETQQKAAEKAQTPYEPLDEERLSDLKDRLAFVYPHEALTRVPVKLAVSELAEKGADRVRLPFFARASLALPALRGTATHLFMECADYDNAARDAQKELERLIERGFIDADSAKLVDVAALEKFFKSDIAKRILSSQILREYEFLDELSAREATGDMSLCEGENVTIQGIADCVIIDDGSVSVVDYKTDRVRGPEELKKRYSAQLALYARAIEKRLGKPVREMIIYSFALGEAITLD